jgi:hypothetical protein
MSFKVAVKTIGDSTIGYNSLRFSTSNEAVEYANDLFSRWMLMIGFDIETSEDAVNYQWVDNQLVSV